MISSGSAQFQLSYELSPIILVGGIAQDVPGGLLPIISLTNSGLFPNGITSTDQLTPDNVGSSLSTNDYFAKFKVMVGGTLSVNEVGNYPFANQAIAANAIIAQPLTISLMMICPANSNTGGYQSKLSIMTNLQAQVSKHNSLGGTYTIATPSFLYTNCILTSLRDISGGESNQPQYEYQWDFIQPLLTLDAAQGAQNSLMNKLGNGTALSGDPPTWSGQQPAVGNPGSGQGPSTVPASQSLVGSSGGGSSPPAFTSPNS